MPRALRIYLDILHSAGMAFVAFLYLYHCLGYGSAFFLLFISFHLFDRDSQLSRQ